MDEEEEYEEELEDLETSNDERTQVVNASKLGSDEATEEEDGEEEDEDEYDDEELSFKDKIQQFIQNLRPGKKQDDEDEDDEEVDSDDETKADRKKPKPNRNKVIIQGIIIAGLIYFVADEFLKEEPIPTPQVRPRADKVPQPPPSEAIKQSPETAPEATSDQGIPVEEDLGLSETFPTESVEQSLDTTIDTPSESDPTESQDLTSPTDLEPPVTVEELPDNTEQLPSTEEPISEPLDIPQVDNQIGQDSNFGGQDDIFGDLASPIESSEGDLTEKILQDLESKTKTDQDSAPIEYVAPPDYEYPGRGLVYNCKALHWACVDGPSYKVCEDNAAYLKENGKAPECYPFNVFETSTGCTSMQNRMVSSGANTDFCTNF